MNRKQIIAFTGAAVLLILAAIILAFRCSSETVSVYGTENAKLDKPLKIQAVPEEGFYWPYLLYIPSGFKDSVKKDNPKKVFFSYTQ